MNIFDYADYLAYVRARIQENGEKRGYLSRLAEVARCQRSYLTQVLKGAAHFTPEHAIGLALFWDLDERESEYFLQLVHLGRTSFRPLRSKIEDRLRALRKEKEQISKRLNQPELGQLQTQAAYYSSWVPSAIDVLVTIEGFRTPETIAARLGLPSASVVAVLRELEKIGTVAKKGKEWHAGSGHLHLPESSPFRVANHQNWRARAVLDAQNHLGDGVHYTSVQSISRKDFGKVRALLLKWIDEQRAIAGPSREEELACFTCDWFRV